MFPNLRDLGIYEHSLEVMNIPKVRVVEPFGNQVDERIDKLEVGSHITNPQLPVVFNGSELRVSNFFDSETGEEITLNPDLLEKKKYTIFVDNGKVI